MVDNVDVVLNDADVFLMIILVLFWLLMMYVFIVVDSVKDVVVDAFVIVVDVLTKQAQQKHIYFLISSYRLIS